MRAVRKLVRNSHHAARELWPRDLIPHQVRLLKSFSRSHGFSVAAGDLTLLDGRWYVTHTGLIGLAHRNRCCGIRTTLQKDLSDPTSGRWVFKAVVYKGPRSRGFVGYGDANPSNVSPLVRGAELRVAETRAVNRALRKAYGIGLCSVEELGWSSGNYERAPEPEKASSNGRNGSNGQPRLRDRLCQIIRQHQLDPSLVKRYAAEFCGTEALRDASRELVESFIQNLAEWAAKDRDGLVCHLNSYSQSQEVHQ